MSSTSLVLDTQIRDWVFIPIVVVMFFVGILRTNIGVLTQTKKKAKVEDVIDGYVGVCHYGGAWVPIYNGCLIVCS